MEREKRMRFFNWVNLPEEMQMEILKRVPVKPLTRCKCVSKSWNHSISTIYPPLSGFLYIGQKNSEENKYFMDYFSCGSEIEDHNCDVASSSSSLLPFEPAGFDLQDCCNGLVLFKRPAVPLEFFVCNPFTKQCIHIPINPLQAKKRNPAFLAFDPVLSPNYRVVVFRRSAEYQKVADVFSSDTGKWVTKVISVDPEHEDLVRRPVYVHGVLYVLSLAYYLYRFDENMNSQHFEFPMKDQTKPRGFIGASKGNLYYSNHDTVNMMVWLFENSFCSKGGGGDCFWTLTHTIKINDLIRSPHGAILESHRDTLQFKPYALHPYSDVIFIGIPQMIFSFHPQTNRLEVFFTAKKDTKIACGQYTVFSYRRCPIVFKDFRTRHQSNPIQERRIS